MVYASRAVAEAWRRSEAVRAEALGPATELMLDLAGVGPGSWVLDVAAGTGEQTLRAARRVGPTGRVLATDISASMLGLAADAAGRAGLANVATRVMDAHQLDLDSRSFDAAISRSGLMLLANPGQALAEIHRVLKPSGKLAAIVFSTAAKNPYPALPFAVAHRHGCPRPPVGQPGMFALGDPGVLEAAIKRVGFRGPAAQPVRTRWRFATVAEALQHYRESFPSLQRLLAALGQSAQQQVWDEIALELGRLATANGLEMAGEVLVGAGTR